MCSVCLCVALPCHLFYLLHFLTTLKLYLSTLLITYLKCCYDYDRKKRVVSLTKLSYFGSRMNNWILLVKSYKTYKTQTSLKAGTDPIINLQLNHMVPVKYHYEHQFIWDCTQRKVISRFEKETDES